MPMVYEELRRIAERQMRGEGSGHTLQATAVVNEAYLKLIDVEVDWKDRVHFYAVSARLIRRMLVDHARAKHREKRGGAATHVALDDVLVIEAEASEDVLELDDAMRRLAAFDERKSQVVELQFFGGLSYDEVAEALGISAATVHRELKLAKAWLHRDLHSQGKR
jgi:RNA polymerase sigma factor (TIGR02999 family)